jgi:hypothetical protein
MVNTASVDCPEGFTDTTKPLTASSNTKNAEDVKHSFNSLKPPKNDIATSVFTVREKKLPWFINATGDICTNLKTLRSYEMISFYNTVKDSLFTFDLAKPVNKEWETVMKCDTNGAAKTPDGSTKCVYPTNVVSVMKHLTEA